MNVQRISDGGTGLGFAMQALYRFKFHGREVLTGGRFTIEVFFILTKLPRSSHCIRHALVVKVVVKQGNGLWVVLGWVWGKTP